MSAPLTTLELIEHVVRLELQQAPVEVLATQMLAPLLEAVGARAGALLCYRRDDGALALAAGRGLAASAPERLGVLRWGGGGAWEMPLRALVERKAYVLDTREHHAFVAELVGADDANTVVAVAAIPLHRWQQPVGVVLAIADRPLEPEQLLEHRLAYDVLAIAMAAALWGGARAPLIDVAAPPPASLVCEAWLDMRLRGFTAADASLDARLADRGAIDAMLQDLRGAVDALRAERRHEETQREARAALGHPVAYGGASGASAATAGVPSTPAPADAAAATGGAAPVDVASMSTEPSDGSTGATAPATAHRVLDGDAVRRDAVAAALARAIPIPPARGLVAANLCDASAATIADLTLAATAGATIVGYAADGTRSRILGAVRCFTDPPASGEATAAVESQPRGGRRMISLSDDIDAFIPAKTELAKLGYSVSMACDEKQAIDLLALLNPDAVLVDLRATPEAAASFVDALAPESGRILTLLVHGDPATGALRRALERLMRPVELEPADLARVCRGVLATAATAARPAGGVSAIRGVERSDDGAKRTAARA